MTARYEFKNLSAVLGVSVAMTVLPPVALADTGPDPVSQTMNAGVETDGVSHFNVNDKNNLTRGVKEKSNVAEK